MHAISRIANLSVSSPLELDAQQSNLSGVAKDEILQGHLLDVSVGTLDGVLDGSLHAVDQLLQPDLHHTYTITSMLIRIGLQNQLTLDEKSNTATSELLVLSNAWHKKFSTAKARHRHMCGHVTVLLAKSSVCLCIHTLFQLWPSLPLASTGLSNSTFSPC